MSNVSFGDLIVYGSEKSPNIALVDQKGKVYETMPLSEFGKGAPDDIIVTTAKLKPKSSDAGQIVKKIKHWLRNLI